MKGAQVGNILAYYIPCLMIIVACYTAIGYHFWKVTRVATSEVTGNSHREMVIVVRKLFLYVLSYFIIWSPWQFATSTKLPLENLFLFGSNYSLII
jgi:predicted ferric reductase